MEQTEVHAAYYEAGHYVAHHYLMPHDATLVVTIVPEEQRRSLGYHAPLYGLEGRLREATPEERSEAERLGATAPGFVVVYEPEDIRKYIVVLYAGEAAELRLDPSRGGEVLRAGARSDDQWAAGLLGDGIPGEYPGLGRPELEEALRQRAANLVAEHWREIEALAAELALHKTLDGDEAYFVVAAAAGDPDARLALEQLRRTTAAMRAGG